MHGRAASMHRGGDWLYAAVVALEAGEGMGARVLRLAHATPAARTVVRVFVAAPSRSVGPMGGVHPLPMPSARPRPLGRFLPAWRFVRWGVFLPAAEGNSRAPGPFSPREEIGRAARVVWPVA